jgi:G3E family GTPase
MAVLKKLNPVAKLIPTTYSRVDLKDILNTKLFDFEKAATSAGWLHSLNAMEMQKNGKMGPKPETEEYGIGSFVYSRRRPFHPRRLYDLIESTFFMIEETFEDEEEEACSAEAEQTPAEKSDRIARKKNHAAFGPLLRSKGFMWLATRPYMSGEWSQAGCILTIQPGSPWFGALPEDEWEMDDDTKEQVKNDFVGEWADRRQELVFIGCQMDRDALESCLDKCLLTDKEFKLCEKIMRRGEDEESKLAAKFEDPFQQWYGDEEHLEEEEEVGGER